MSMSSEIKAGSIAWGVKVEEDGSCGGDAASDF